MSWEVTPTITVFELAWTLPGAALLALGLYGLWWWVVRIWEMRGDDRIRADQLKLALDHSERWIIRVLLFADFAATGAFWMTLTPINPGQPVTPQLISVTIAFVFAEILLGVDAIRRLRSERDLAAMPRDTMEVGRLHAQEAHVEHLQVSDAQIQQLADGLSGRIEEKEETRDDT